MKCFNYKILKGSTVVFKNTIHSSTKEEAIKEIEKVKEEFEGTDFRFYETKPSSKWSC